jgi:hypothetical protein
MSDLNIQIAIKTTADASGVRVAAEAVQGLDRELAHTANTIEEANATPLKNFPTKVEESGKQMQKMSQFANQASYQITDFVTQVSMGTSSITAFSQQAPQLLGTMTQMGMVTGKAAMGIAALSVAIPVALMAGAALFRWVSQSTEEVSKWSEETDKSVGKVAKSLGELDTKALEDADKKAQNATQSAFLLAQKFDDVGKAEDASSMAALDNAAKNIQAQALVAQALGLQVDQYQQLLALADIEQQKMEQAAKAAIGDANQAMQQAVLEAWKKTEDTKRGEKQKQQLAENLALQQQILDKIIAQNQAADGANIRRKNDNPGGEVLGNLAIGNVGGALEAEQRRLKNSLAQDAYDKEAAWRKDLEAAQRSRVEALISNLAKTTEETALNDAELENANRKLNAQDGATKEKIAQINQTLEAASGLQQLETVAATGKQLATDIDAALATMNATTPQQQAAVEDLKKITSDRVIESNEIARLITDLRTLTGGLQVGTTETTANVQQLIRICAGLQDTARQQAEQIRSLGSSR